MGRNGWRSGVAYAALALAFSAGAAWAQLAVTLRAAEQEGYARLVFEGGGNLIEETRIAGDTLFIRFGQPIQLDVSNLPVELEDYVSSASLSSGGSILSLNLRKSIVIKTADQGNAAMVDLIDTAGDVAEVPVVPVRVGEHDTFDRVVFDWESNVDYDVRQRGRQVDVTFERDALPDFSRMYDDPPPLLRSAEVDREDGKLIVSFFLTGPAEVSSLRDGPRIAIDFNRLEAERELTDEEVAEREAEAAAEAAAAAEPPVALELTPRPDEPEIIEPRNVTLEVSAIASGTRLRLPLEERTPAAVFSRGGQLWLVLKGDYIIDYTGLADVDRSLVQDGEVMKEGGLTILRIGMDPAFQVIARRMNESWEVDLTLYPAAPVDPLQVSRQQNPELGPMVFVETGAPPDIVEVTDPAVGDRLAIVPLLENGQGLLEARRFSEFSLLKSAQGVVVQLVGDKTRLTEFENGVGISGGRGLMMAPPEVSRSGQVREPASPVMTTEPLPLVDFEGWRRGPESEYQAVRADLLERLSLADEGTRNERRFDLATFHLGHGMATETIGILSLMADDDPSLEREPAFLAVRGIANYMLRRYDAARADLSHPDLADDPHVALWQSLIDVEAEDWEAAYNHYRDGLEVLATYNETRRAEFQLGVVKAARALGDMETAKRELLVLSNYDLPPSLRSETTLLLGEVYAEEEDSEKALAAYDDAIADDYRPTRVRAEFNRVAELVAEDAISREEAISELERLRYVWRGDDLELQALRLLGDLYLEEKNYREALSRMRSAVTQFSGTQASREIARKMGDVFRDLYLGDAPADMTPLRALALYYDFRELTPIGYEGDQMIRRLADRLVKVDLLDKAAELLEHQVNFRLEGAAKAQVAENLAVVYLLDRKPEKALQAIMDSEQPQLPEDITRRRRHLEARALTELNRYDEAAYLLEDDMSSEATALKADLYWRAANWSEAAEASRALLEDQAVRGEATDYSQILRLAVATSLAGDKEALPGIAAEYGDEMREGPYARTFDLITSDTPTTGSELRDIVNSIADVSSYETYLASYKDELSTAAIRPE